MLQAISLKNMKFLLRHIPVIVLIGQIVAIFIFKFLKVGLTPSEKVSKIYVKMGNKSYNIKFCEISAWKYGMTELKTYTPQTLFGGGE